MSLRHFFVIPNHLPRWILFLIILVVLGNFAGLFAVGVHTDESYYWIWSRYLDWSYYDHPPLVAWMIRLSSEIFGDNEFALRFPAILSWAVASVVVYKITVRFFTDNKLAGWVSVLVLISIPIFQVGFHIVGPDSPLMLFTSLTYLFVYKAIDHSNWKNWVLAGVSLGFALLGKYTAILLPAIVFLTLVMHKDSRQLLLRWQPWIGMCIAAILFLPVIYWNSQHGWISFGYQWHHGTESEKSFSVFKTLDYISQQMSAVMPWTWLAMIVASFKASRLVQDSNIKLLRLLQIGFWFPLLFFGIAGTFSTSMHNWPVIAYIPGSILLGGFLSKFLGKGRDASSGVNKTKVAVIFAAVFSALLVDLARFPQWVGLLDNPKRLSGSSIVATWGWDGLANKLRRVEEKNHFSKSCQIFFIKNYNDAWLGYFHVAGEIAWQFRNPDRILLEPVRHQKQYNYWKNTKLDDLSGVCMVIAGPANHLDFPKTLTKKKIGLLKLDATHTITLPDTTSSYYGIYIKAGKKDK